MGDYGKEVDRWGAFTGPEVMSEISKRILRLCIHHAWVRRQLNTEHLDENQQLLLRAYDEGLSLLCTKVLYWGQSVVVEFVKHLNPLSADSVELFTARIRNWAEFTKTIGKTLENVQDEARSSKLPPRS